MTWPFENDTGAVIRRLAQRSLQSEKRRNRMVLLAVALSAFLICFAGALNVSLFQTLKNQVTDTWEAVFTGATRQQVEELRSMPEFARVGAYYMVGAEQDARGCAFSFVYSDAETLYMFRSQMALEQGRLPETGDEVAVSSYFLSQWAPDAGLGDTVRLETESFQGTYRICGILTSFGERETGTFGVLISRDMLQGWAGYDPAGYRAYVHLAGQPQGEEEVLALCRRIAEGQGLPVPGTNTQYFRFHGGFDPNMLSLMGVVAVLVLLGSGIVIQSIFRISVQDKIQSYGQLRTLGATRRQIRRMVRREGRRLGLQGSVAGALAGAGAAFLLQPQGFHPGWFGAVLAAGIAVCLGIVALSIRQPVALAARVSPLEAVRYAPGQAGGSRPRKGRRITPLALGVRNFTREPRKAASIAASLSVGGVLLLVFSSILLVRSPERQARQFFPAGDYKIYLDTDRPEAEIMAEGNPLDEALKAQILALDGVTAVQVERQSVHAEFYTGQDADGAQCDMLTPANRALVEAALTEGALPTDDHSILMARDIPEYYDSISLGSQLTLRFGEVSATVTVVGFYAPTAVPLANGRVGLNSPRLFATPALFRQLLPDVENFDYAWTIVSDPAKAAAVEAGLENIVAGHAGLALDKRADKEDYFRQMDAIGFGSFQLLSWLIFLFGVVNLVNTTLSNQLARRRENSILRAVGLTRRQLYAMTLWEGLCCAGAALAVTVAVGLPLSLAVCRVISAMTYGGRVVPYRFPLGEMGLFAAALLGVELLLSLWSIGRQRDRSLVEQMGRAD